jgi:branched-chain amino acid transport system ATP-binding protein
MLELLDVQVAHGGSRVLRGVDLRVRPGEIVALLGRNGAGRSTLLKAVMGLVPATGQLSWQGQGLQGRAAHDIARLGMGYVPEGREIFPGLSVLQNLAMGLKPGRHASTMWPLEDVWRLFPALAARRDAPGGVLSGGEQQMLTLARTLQGDPAAVLVDEPTEGLAPAVVQQVAALLAEMRRRGLAVLLVEQKLTIALDLCDRCAVLGQGRVVFEGTAGDLRAATAVQQEWLAV